MTSKGATGGEKAADKLNSVVRSYLRQCSKESDDWTVMATAYANVEGLAQTLVRLKLLSGVAELRSFVTAFTNRQPLYSVVDVGHGKERADTKIKGNGKQANIRGKWLIPHRGSKVSPRVSTVQTRDTWMLLRHGICSVPWAIRQ
jgi:hypothetical protein